MLTSCETGEEFCSVTVTWPALALSVVGVQESWPCGLAVTVRLLPPPPPPPEVAPPPPPPPEGALAAGLLLVVVPLSLPQATKPTAAVASTATSANALVMVRHILSSLWTGNSVPLLRGVHITGSDLSSLEFRLLPCEKGLHAAPEVLRAHAVGDAVTLELEVVGEAVLDAQLREELCHADVVRSLGAQLLGLLPRPLHQLVRRHNR